MEQTKFKDIAHLYLGCEVSADKAFYPGFKAKLISTMVTNSFADGIPLSNIEFFAVKPLLRKLDSMTEEEHNQLMKICLNDEFKTLDKAPVGCGCPKGFAWLLYKHFDLFNLIESGEALDINEVKNK